MNFIRIFFAKMIGGEIDGSGKGVESASNRKSDQRR